MRFKLICCRCNSENVSLYPVSPPHMDDGYFVRCDDCGQHSVDIHVDEDVSPNVLANYGFKP